MKNKFIIWNDKRLFVGSNPRAISQHTHPVIQLVIALSGHFLSKDKQGLWREKKGLLIAPNHVHECNAEHVPILSLDIDPESTLGEWILNHQLKKNSIIDYPTNDLAQLDFEDFSKNVGKEDWEFIEIYFERIFSFEKTNGTSKKDQRVEKILSFISDNIDKTISTKALMDTVFLSESRMLHLFKEKMGLPIRNYILWYRLKIVFQQILAGNSLTNAAHYAGFSDQAHMTRTFVNMIGIPPSIMVKNSKFIQVSFPE